MILAEALVKLTGDTKQFDASMDRAADKVAKTGKAANTSKASFVGLFKAMMPAIGWGAVTAAVGASLAAFADAEKTVAKLRGQLSLMSGATEETVEQFKNIATEIQAKQGIGDEDVVRGMLALTRTTNDYNVALKHTGTLTDFAAATGMNLEQAAVLLGRAYNGDTAALNRYGISLKDGIKGQEVMAEISKRFGGIAESQANTLDGAYKRLKQSMGDLAEEGGRNLGPFFTVLVNEWIIPAIKWVTKLTQAFKGIESDINIRAITEDIKLQKEEVEKAEKAYEKLIKKYGEASTQARVGAKNIEIQTAALSKLEKKLSEAKDAAENLKSGQKDLSVGVDATGNSMDDAGDKAKEYEKKVKDATDSLTSQAQAAASVVGPIITTATEALLNSQLTLNEKMGEILKSGLYAILDVVGLQIKAYIAAEAAKAVATGGLTAGTVVATTAQLVAVDALKAAVGTIKFAKGGVVYGPTPGIFGEAGPEAVMPLDRIQPIVNKAVQSSLTTNVGGVTVQIAANRIDNNTNFDAIAVKIDKALKKLGKQRGER